MNLAAILPVYYGAYLGLDVGAGVLSQGYFPSGQFQEGLFPVGLFQGSPSDPTGDWGTAYFTTVKDITISSTGTNAANRNDRHYFPASYAGGKGYQVKLTYRGHPTPLQIKGASLGVMSGMDFTEAPTRITFDGGSSTVNIGDTTKVSDVINYQWNNDDNIIGFHCYNIGGYHNGTPTGPYEYARIYDTDDTVVQDVSTYVGNANRMRHITKVEVVTSHYATTEEPSSVVYNSVTLTRNDAGGYAPGQGYWSWVSGTLAINVGEVPQYELLEINYPAESIAVTNDGESLVTTETARISGTTSGDGITNCGAVWNLTGSPDIGDNVVNAGAITGAFYVDLIDLPIGTLIYFNTYVTDGVTPAYGTEDSFTTLARPSVVTGTYTVGDTNTAASVAATDSGVGALERGICYGPTHNPIIEWPNWKVAALELGPGAYSCDLDIPLNYLIYARSYVIDQYDDVIYGDEIEVQISHVLSPDDGTLVKVGTDTDWPNVVTAELWDGSGNITTYDTPGGTSRTSITLTNVSFSALTGKLSLDDIDFGYVTTGTITQVRVSVAGGVALYWTLDTPLNADNTYVSFDWPVDGVQLENPVSNFSSELCMEMEV